MEYKKYDGDNSLTVTRDYTQQLVDELMATGAYIDHSVFSQTHDGKPLLFHRFIRKKPIFDKGIANDPLFIGDEATMEAFTVDPSIGLDEAAYNKLKAEFAA